ncbi:MAG: hypothetical protein E6J03_07790 [Chloroflexi bacterium]|nr:MAG: hypothetical protein E6J03_07790 [Chloroflexota bacterium]
MSSVPDTGELRRAGLSALGWSALLWLPAGLLVAVGVVATGRIGSGYPEAVLGFIVDEAGVGYCFVIMAIACGVGYPIAQARRPVLPSGLVESQIFAVIVYAAMLVVSLPLQAILLQGMGLHPDRAVLAAIVVPPKVAAALVAAGAVYPWYLARRERA